MSAGGAIPIAGTMLMELVGPGKTRLVYDYCRPVGVNAEDFEATLDNGIRISKESNGSCRSSSRIWTPACATGGR